MKVLTSAAKLSEVCDQLKKNGRELGFVPTMGYLHEGHLSIVRQSRRRDDATLVSIFVNPLQFGPKDDFARYPRDLERDKALLTKEKVDFLFLPSAKNFYPADFQTDVSVRRLRGPLCGRARPGHFAGVATVVLKLLNIVCPERIYLGQKDYQQFRVIEQMIKDLSVPVGLVIAPTVREKSGLAMSSRNALLTVAQKKQAPVLYATLREGEAELRAGSKTMDRLKTFMKRRLIRAAEARVEYAEIVDAQTLENVIELQKGRTVLIAMAVYFGQTRLIDNILVKV